MIPVVYNSSSDIPLTWLIILIQSDFKFFEKYLSLQVKKALQKKISFPLRISSVDVILLDRKLGFDLRM